jgi:hypothetical protein
MLDRNDNQLNKSIERTGVSGKNSGASLYLATLPVFSLVKGI